MSDLPKDFDSIAVVVDWLDACRKRDVAALLDLYAGDASVECACEGIAIQGRSALEGYWRPRLDAFVPTAFGLEEIEPAADGVVLDYSSYAGKPVRIVFNFSADGKIRRTRCGPVDRSGGS
jgi:ketosteroid isomerase-like protein